MRDIEFRAWFKRTKRFLNSDEWVFTNNEFIDTDDGCSFAEDVIFEQYTGLKDENGVKIFEGDIVSCPGWSKPKQEIAFMEGGFCTVDIKTKKWIVDINTFYPSIGCQIEVLGNIHEENK